MKLKAELSFVFDNSKEAEAVTRAISPDNLEVPGGLRVKTVRRGSSLSTLVDCKKSLETFIATLDDLLACASVAEKAVESVKSS